MKRICSPKPSPGYVRADALRQRARVVRAQRLGAPARRACAAAGRARPAAASWAVAARRRTPGPPGGVGGLTRGFAATAATAALVVAAAVDLALLPGLVLGAHHAEDEVEQADRAGS